MKHGIGPSAVREHPASNLARLVEVRVRYGRGVNCWWPWANWLMMERIREYHYTYYIDRVVERTLMAGSVRWQCAEADNLSRLNGDQGHEAFRKEREQVLNPIRVSANNENRDPQRVQILLVGEILVES